MKVLLLLTCLEIIEESYHDSLNAAYPLGLAYLHGYLESVGHEVVSLDLSEVPYEQCVTRVLDEVSSFEPDAVGFQLLTSTRASGLRIARLIADRRPSAHVILGGVHATEMWRRLLLQNPDYFIVRQEGELSFAGLLNSLASGQDPGNVPGVAFVRGGDIVNTGPALVIQDLDTIPFPRHDLFIKPETRYASLMTSRGCPFACSFCSVARRPMRFRSVANVVDEIEYIAQTFPQVETIRIWDDQFFYKVDRVIAICDEIVRRGIRMQFICLGRLKPLSKALILALERAGFIHVLLGLESGSPRVLEQCNKKILPKDALNAARYFKDSSIDISMFLIVGLEGESEETIVETGALVQEIQKIKYFPGWANVGIATVYPGTDLYNSAVAGGWLDDRYWDDLDHPVPLFTLEHSYSKLEAMVDTLAAHIDPTRILVSREAYLKQRHLIPSILGWVYRSIGQRNNPYRTKRDLTPLTNLVSKAIKQLELEGQFMLRIGASLREQIAAGTASLTTIRREDGFENRFVLDIELVSREQVVLHILRQICSDQQSPLFERICQGVDRYLADQHGVDLDAVIEPATTSVSSVLAALSPSS